jgi:hypothetical protein
MRISFSYDYASCVRASERTSWRVEDLIPEGTRLDLTRPLLPKSLSAAPIACLDAPAQLMLNHLAGNAYLNLFSFVEEFILATVVQQAGAELFGDPDNMRALVRFADEELKHQQLFARFRKAFDASFGHPARVLETAKQVAGAVLDKSPLGVMLIILHIELMTLDHYTESVRGDETLDAFFATLLEKHWLEESQHARIDALELAKLANVASDAQVAVAAREYLDLLGAFDGLLAMQAQMDVETLAEALGRVFTEEQAAAIVEAQHRGYRRTFLVAGIRTPRFAKVLTTLAPETATAADALATAWCP